MHTQVAARLIKGHKVRLARAIARQIQQIVPRYREMDSTALERNLGTLLSATETFLENGDDRQLIDLTRNVMELRAVSGFALGDFVMATACWLPVLRRFILERSASVDEGLRVYESVEAVALPLMGRIADLYQQIGNEVPEDPAEAFERFFRAAGKFVPASIERVQGDDSDER